MAPSQTTLDINESQNNTTSEFEFVNNVIDITNRLGIDTNISSEPEPDEYTLVYEANDHFKRIEPPPINLETGYRVKIIVKKEKISFENIFFKGNLTKDVEYDSNERILKMYLSTFDELNKSKQELSIANKLNQEISVNNEKNLEQIKILKEELTKMKIKPLKKIISYTYGFIIPLLAIICLISGMSLLGLNFIPSPVDKTLFWSCFAGSIGLYLDYLTKDKKYAR